MKRNNLLLLKISTLIFAFLCIFSAFNVVLAYAETEKKIIPEELMLIFSADYGQGEQIFSSSYKNQNWTTPLQISESTIYVFHPVAAIDNDNGKWAVWTQVDDNGKYLYFSFFNGTDWSRAKRIFTQTSENSSPTLQIDRNGTPLLAWVGVEGKYSDVYFSHWNGSNWAKPVMVNSINSVPDINPNFAIEPDGQVVLSWLTFLDGKYVNTARILDDKQRVIARLPSSKKRVESNIHKRIKLPVLPEFVKDLNKGSFFVKTSAGSESFPLNQY